MVKSPKMQLTNVTTNKVKPPLKSPTDRLKSWLSPKLSYKPPACVASVSEVDKNVVGADRARTMDEMTKLYAKAMAQKVRPALPPPVSNYNARMIHHKDHDNEINEMDHLRGGKQAPRQLIHPMAPTPINSALPDHNDSIGSQGIRESSIDSDEEPLLPGLYDPGSLPPVLEQGRASQVESFRRKAPSALSLRSVTASNWPGDLPFRQVYPETLWSAPSTKKTFTEVNIGVNGPRTGVPKTPYSPYTPFTPMTPVTPRHLVTKQELKRSKKQNNKKGLTEDDVVLSDEAIWGRVK